MPRDEHLILCGGASYPSETDARVLRLDLDGPAENVHLQIKDIKARLLANLPDQLLDLLEIAAFIYAADSAIGRGGPTDAQMGARWRRRFRFVIPVRQPGLWASGAVSTALVETLGFLSDDDYAFEFRQGSNLSTAERYFEFPEDESAAFSPNEVILFSGGLDSLAGTVEALSRGNAKVALVSHCSATKISSTQKYLMERLRERFGADRIRHIPVRANLAGNLTKETTHRTRSFLFAALGAVTARLFGNDHIRFFENGIVSLNLPPAAQVVGARATRTTHPQVLAGFRRIFDAVFSQPFSVENPYAWMTKAEVVGRISAGGCGDLIRHSRSCTRVHDMTKLHPHCGRCSQCIDRRFGILAAGLAHEDPSDGYKVDLFAGERVAGPDREIALAFIRSATGIDRMTEVAFFAQYGEISRVVRHYPDPADVVAQRIFDLHKRHASAVCRIFDEATRNHAAALRQGDLPVDCLLGLIVGRDALEGSYPTPVRGSQPAPLPERDIRIAIDEAGKRVEFDGWGEIRGVGAMLLIALAASFRQALTDERAPENYPYRSTSVLMRQTDCTSDELFRRRVQRCRIKIANLAVSAGVAAPVLDAVIENSQWHGYRLNPDRIRIVAISELKKSMHLRRRQNE